MFERTCSSVALLLTVTATLLNTSPSSAAQKPVVHQGKPAASPAMLHKDNRIGLPLLRSKDLVIAFSTMYGVDGPFIGEDNPIRDIIGDELPWSVVSAAGALDARGHLAVRVRGLVFKDDPSVPPELRGINDEAEFRAAVSCLTEATDGTPTVNVLTSGFPATISGDCDILTTVDLPNPCIAPVVMILAGSEDKWFAVTGVETHSEAAH